MRSPFQVIFIALLCAASGFAQDSSQAVGRFQIASGTIQTIGLNNPKSTTIAIQVPIVVKIDTQTGETWILASVADKTGYREGWIPLGDLPPPAKK